MSKKSRLIPAAIAYDFDGTLAPGNMQEREFIPDVQITPQAFWKEVKALAKAHDMDEILAYLELMLQKANHREIPIRKETFENYGRALQFFPGVDGWFDRINKHAKGLGISLKHYVISSGLREMINATSIAKHFAYVFASGFRYDHNGVACWPALAVNYTTKSQYLFRINKGIPNSYDNSQINKFMPNEDRPLPFENMIYLGDGETDIPAMKMVTYQGGRAIAVYPKRTRGAKDASKLLVEQQRANGAAPADYNENSPLDKAVKAYLEEIAARWQFRAAAKV